MSLLLAGIDEAGYGPTLGPLCVGMSVFRIHNWTRGDPAPDLWQLLNRAVCEKPSDAKHRISIADSKALKLSNDSKTRHPLIHLERGVLSFLRSQDHTPAPPSTDAELFQLLGANLPHDQTPWYSGDPTPLPLGQTAGEISIASAKLAAALESAGIELVGLHCHIIPEPEFNDIIRRTNSKAEATAAAFGHHLRRLAKTLPQWCHCSPSSTKDLQLPEPRRSSETTPDSPPYIRLVCDQLGGRTAYEGLIARELPNSEVTALAESGERSRYSVVHQNRDRQGADTSEAPDFIIQFMPEAESAHLPVALASMVAKLTRELAMHRFNRYWCARNPELKPTAGYATDARRWLNEVGSSIDAAERKALIRLA